MKKIFVWFLIGAIVSSLIFTGSISPNQKSFAFPPVKAFPEAEGFGENSLGGRGGVIIEVTNTNDSGGGSLRDCVAAAGARTCVFKVGGLIELDTPLTISNPYITIAGQTAPGGGITIRLGSSTEVFLTKTHDVIIRYISVRAGPGGENHNNQIASDGTELYNVIIDHNSLSWGVDSNIETWYRVNGATIQWSLISEGLNDSTHSKGEHSKGIMIGGYKGDDDGTTIGSENISVLNNIMAHNADRNPLMQLCGTAQVINNTTYNPMYTFSHQQLNCPLGESYVNWINNYHKAGPDSTSEDDLKIIPIDSGACLAGKTYMSGNVGSSGTWLYELKDSCVGRSDIIVGVAAAAPTVFSVSAVDSYNSLLSNGGAGNSRGMSCDGTWYNRRDSIDTRVINDVIIGTGSIIDDPSEVGGWITPDIGSPCTDTDHDGMPDVWEQNYELDYTVAGSQVDTDGDGYTNIEEYLNGTNPLDLVNPTDTPTLTPTLDPTITPTLTPTNTTIPTPTDTVIPTNTIVPTNTPISTPTLTPTGTIIITPTDTISPTNTVAPTSTLLPTATMTPTVLVINTATSIPTNTVRPTTRPTSTPILNYFTNTPIINQSTATPSVNPAQVDVIITNTLKPTIKPTDKVVVAPTNEVWGNILGIEIPSTLVGNSGMIVLCLCLPLIILILIYYYVKKKRDDRFNEEIK